MDRRASSLIETAHIGTLVGGKRTVFYEEMAQYSLRYIDPGTKDYGDAEAESRYHLNNLTLLSMYFDIIFLQTASLFNVSDRFVKLVIQRTISNPKFCAMLTAGTVRICGWGGRSPHEMLSNAMEYSSAGAAVDHRVPDGYITDVARIFLPANMAFRSEGRPDKETAEAFRRKLRQTEIVRHNDDLDRIDDAIHQSEKLMGQLTAIAFVPALDLGALRMETRRSLFPSFISSWSTHLNQSIPGIYAYIPGGGLEAIQHTIQIDGRAIRSFLYSPKVFAAFLKQYFSLPEYNRIVGRPHEDLEKLRNGDWKMFCDAYHAAVEEVSDSIVNVDPGTLTVFDLDSEASWGKRIGEQSNKQSGDFDISAFIESLASISGLLLGVPLLGPAFRAVGTLLKAQINSIPKKLVQEHRSAVSPYIKKVRMSLQIGET